MHPSRLPSVYRYEPTIAETLLAALEGKHGSWTFDRHREMLGRLARKIMEMEKNDAPDKNA